MSLFTELLSGLIGAIIGGGLSLSGSHYAVKRQMKEQKKLELDRELKMMFIALNSVRGEILHNINQSHLVSEVMSHLNTDRFNFSEKNFSSNFHVDRWSRHCDIIGVIDHIETVESITLFYSYIYIIQSTNTVLIEHLSTLQNEGSKAIDLIDISLGEIHKLQDKL